MAHDGCNYFLFWVILDRFLPFHPLNNTKNKNFEKVTVQKVGALPKNSEKSLLRDLGVNDAKKKFNKFWDIVKTFWMKLLQLMTHIIVKDPKTRGMWL